MVRSDEYRALRLELLRMSKVGFENRADITRLQNILEDLVKVCDYDIIAPAMRFSFLIPSLRKQYVNFDDGDTAYWEEDWDYEQIKYNLDLFVNQMYHGLKAV